MIIIMKQNTGENETNPLLAEIQDAGLNPFCITGSEKVILCPPGDTDALEKLQLENNPLVEKVIPILTPYKLAGRTMFPSETLVTVSGETIGPSNFTVIAGPCAVESEDQVMKTAEAISKLGLTFMRGGAYKPRSSPYSFQGLHEDGLKILAAAREQYGVKIVTEVLSMNEVELVSQYADILQVGARNMQNFRLLEALGKCDKPILLKRGISASIEELLMSAEYILNQGNPNVILCERGIRTFETAYRNTLDLAAVPVLKRKTHLPVIVDPSHAAGNRDLVPPLAKAALACGADGLLVEIHPDPANARCDGKQSLNFKQFTPLMKQLRAYAKIEGRTL